MSARNASSRPLPSPATRAEPAAPAAEFRAIIALPTDLPDQLTTAAAEGWRVLTITALRNSNDHAAYITKP